MGHKVTAIDCSGEMLNEARGNFDFAGVDVETHKMDSHKLGFADNSFDLIIMRNVVWTLYNPQAAYREYYRVLKPGGRILVFDANWGLAYTDETIQQKNAENARRYYSQTNKAPLKSNTVDDKYGHKMFLSDKFRPDWDISEMASIGFSVSCERDVTQTLWNEQRKALYNATPLFMVCGEKPLKEAGY